MLIKYIFWKVLSNFFSTFVGFLLIFYVVSTIENLSLEISLFNLLIVSILDALSIILIVPEIVFFFSCIFFFLILRASNELLLIKHYLSKLRISLAFIIFIIFISLLDINNESINENINHFKFNMLSSDRNENISLKTMIYEDDNYKDFYLFDDIDLINKTISSFKIHKFFNGKHLKTITAEDANFRKDKVNFNSSTIITSKNIYKTQYDDFIEIKDFERYLHDKRNIIQLKDKKIQIKTNDFFKYFNICILLLIITYGALSTSSLRNNFKFLFQSTLIFLIIPYVIFVEFVNISEFRGFFMLFSSMTLIFLFLFIKNHD